MQISASTGSNFGANQQSMGINGHYGRPKVVHFHPLREIEILIPGGKKKV
jgi:hypothetical protein